MIEGLKVTVSGAKLRELCLKQTEFHTQRAKFYAEQYESVNAAVIAAGEALGTVANYSGHNDPKVALRDRRLEHENKARHLTFVAENLEAGESYRLDSTDLQVLGVIRGSRF